MTHAAEPSPGAAGADIVRRAEPVDVPIQWQANGTARVAPRVNLEFVLWSQREGMRPEEIVRRLPALDLADVYAVIAYALRHPEEMEDYLRSAREMEERARAELDALHPDRQERIERIRARHVAMQQERQLERLVAGEDADAEEDARRGPERLAAEIREDQLRKLIDLAKFEAEREARDEDGEPVNWLPIAEDVESIPPANPPQEAS